MDKNQIEKFEYAFKFIQNTNDVQQKKLPELRKAFEPNKPNHTIKGKDIDFLIDYVNDRNELIGNMLDFINDMISANKNEEF